MIDASSKRLFLLLGSSGAAGEGNRCSDLERHAWMSSDDPVSEPDPKDEQPSDDVADWRARVRKWASLLGDWVDALLPVPSPAPVLVPVPVRTRRRR